VPYGSKIYIRLDFPLTAMKVDGDVLINDEGNKIRAPMFAFGISKDFYFLRRISVSPYLGITSLLTTSDNEATIERVGKSGSNIEIGANGSFAILDNIQVVGSIGYNGLKGSFYSIPIAIGVGARYQF
jgi:hypothetical protein